MAKKLVHLQIITPELKALAVETDSVVIPAHDGELGVLVDRAPLMCELGVGALRYRDGSHTRRIFVDGGFAQVHRNQVTVLTQAAATPDEITPAMIQQAEKAAETAKAEERGRALRRVGVLRELAHAGPQRA
jgi:F-type H+-transporting ATPase subunit epsilon